MTTIGRPITSASTPYRPSELTSRSIGLRDRRRTKVVLDPLETRLWQYYDRVEGIGSYVTLLSNTADLVTYFPAVASPDPSAEPEQSTDAAVLDVWEAQGGETWLSEWAAELVKHMSVAGQAWLVPVPADAEQRHDQLVPSESTLVKARWEIWSTHEVRRALKLSAGDDIPTEDARLWRVWMPHPEDALRADSPVRRVADKCESLLLLDLRRQADLRSRAFAGVWPLPAGLKDEKTPSGKTYADLIEEAMTDPINNSQSVASYIPIMAWVDEEDEKIMRGGPISLAIDDPDRINELEDRLLRRVAIGIDAPQELITGIGDLNHWSAWIIEKSTYTQHLDPMLVRILRSLSPWWRSLLEAQGVDPTNQVLWRNAASAIAQPNKFDQATKLFGEYVISSAALREAADYSDEDAPDDDEIEKRIRIVQLSSPLALSQLAQAGGAPPVDVDTDETSNPQEAPDPADGTPESENPAEATIQAQNEPDTDLTRAALALALARIDETLLIRTEAEAARQQLKLRRKLLDRIAAAVKDAGLEVGDKDTVGVRLGEAQVRALGVDFGSEADFNAGPFASIIESAQDQTATQTARVGADRNRDADADDREAAVAFIVAALYAAVVGSLFKRPEAEGETGLDGAELVPIAEVRAALDIAGGGAAVRDGVQDAWELIGNGRRTVADLIDVGVTTTGFVWDYGSAPRTPFPPHQALDGVTFDRWDAPALRQTTETWVGGEFWFPADHKGCRCTLRRVLTMEAAAVA